METWRVNLFPINLNQFKSYYVVWKLKDEATEIIGFDGV